ncbi:hypothetical protein [Streptomyces sp. NPDC048349]|uniref:hypothetical protein n=1 Tax=Streptomyces sp. NPDC048349 TaxID=3155486 RepID=UPI0034444BB3
MIQGFRPPRWLACAALAAATLSSAAPAHARALAPAPAAARAVPLALVLSPRVTLAPAAAPAARAAAPAAAAPAAAPAAAAPAAAPAAGAPRARGPLPAEAADPPDGPRDGLAGSAAGAGRPHPGRPVTEPANPEMLVASRPLPPVRPRPEPPEPPRAAATPPPATVGALGTGPNERAADLAAHILPLGTGFALMGLGLGYLGMRLRKGL